jgi:hypothetical protein
MIMPYNLGPAAASQEEPFLAENWLGPRFFIQLALEQLISIMRVGLGLITGDNGQF